MTTLTAVAAGKHYRLARDCVTFDATLMKVIGHVFGSTVICDSLDDANKLRFEKEVMTKCVTLDGSVVAKNGNMTGGVGGDFERKAAR